MTDPIGRAIARHISDALSKPGAPPATPSAILTRAADLIRDAAAAWVEATDEDWTDVVEIRVRDHYDDRAIDAGHAWARLVPPAVAGPLEALLRQAALAYELDNDVTQDENALALARQLLGEDQP